jgi:tellurite resistance protein TehA-like permease
MAKVSFYGNLYYYTLCPFFRELFFFPFNLKQQKKHIYAATFGSTFKISAGILSDPAAFPFFIPFIAWIIPLLEGGLILICSSGRGNICSLSRGKELSVLRTFQTVVSISLVVPVLR